VAQLALASLLMLFSRRIILRFPLFEALGGAPLLAVPVLESKLADPALTAAPSAAPGSRDFKPVFNFRQNTPFFLAWLLLSAAPVAVPAAAAAAAAAVLPLPLLPGVTSLLLLPLGASAEYSVPGPSSSSSSVSKSWTP
jgi:hypothetical protein